MPVYCCLREISNQTLSSRTDYYTGDGVGELGANLFFLSLRNLLVFKMKINFKIIDDLKGILFQSPFEAVNSVAFLS